MLKPKSYKKIILIFIVLSLLVYCDKSTEVLNTESTIRIEKNLISYTELPTEFDSTYYQHNSNWEANFDTTAADSMAVLLADSVLLIREMWFPQSTLMCGIPIRVGSEVIIKLSKQDTMIFNLGFEPYFGFPFRCVQIWRHYKFIEK